MLKKYSYMLKSEILSRYELFAGFFAIFLDTYMIFVALNKLTGFSIFVVNWIILVTIAASLSLIFIVGMWMSYFPFLGITLIK